MATCHERGEGFDIAADPTVIISDDVEAGRELPQAVLALYIGGMGARGKNFYNDLACRYGFEDAASRSRTCTSTARSEATASVPDELVDEVAWLVRRTHRDRLDSWRSRGSRR